MMISQKLVQQVQNCADRLTHDLVEVLQTSPRSPAYRTIPSDRLIELKTELYKNLGRWLSSRSKSAVQSRYVKLGRERYLAGIPLSQVLFAQNTTKSMLLHFIDRCMPGEAEDLRLENELVLAISEFFDEAIYWVSVGYEDARQAHVASPEFSQDAAAEFQPASRWREPAPVAAGEVPEDDLPISRAGDIGEASG